MGMGDPLMVRNISADGACTMMSAPIPSMRFAVSWSIPEVSPTITITSITSKPIANTPMAVRTGR